MDLFHMQRYWSDDEENESSIKDVQPKQLTKKRKNSDSITESKENVEIVQGKKDEEENEPSKKSKRNKKKKKNRNEQGFTVLGQVLSADSKKKVNRILPEWLAHPDVIPADYNNLLSIQDLKNVDPSILETLRSKGISTFFPVQSQVIPRLMSSVRCNFFRPNDVCVSAPTGSGKTLAYVIPLLQSLKDRVVPRIRALVVLPVHDLAIQVYKVFQTFNQGLGLRIKVLSMTKTFQQEQKDLVREGVCGLHSMVDILIATPGRLVDHIQKTRGFQLDHLRYLVIDEADRVMEDVQNDWLTQVEESVYSNGRERPGPLNVANSMRSGSRHLQKLLFSATLSQQPEHLQDLNLFEPKLFTSVAKPKNELVIEIEGEEDAGKDATPTEDENPEGFAGQFTTPEGLTEKFLTCVAGEKIKVLEFLVRTMEDCKRTLIFTNAVYRAHNLKVHLKEFGISAEEFTSKTSKNRSKVLKQFEAGKIEALVCSDVVSRGIDFGEVDLVVSFDCPTSFKTYIHRIGRTARAGKSGTSIIMLEPESREEKMFNQWLKQAGKKDVEPFTFDSADLKTQEYERVRDKVAQILAQEKSSEKKFKSRKPTRSEKKGIKTTK